MVGSRYFITHDVFHRIKTVRAVTLLKRGSIVKEMAEVIRPASAVKVCPFSKKIDDGKLWHIVEGILTDAYENPDLTHV